MTSDAATACSLADIAGPGDIAAIVGAGGKTTTMFALAKALAERGLRVVTTKSTNIHRPSLARAPKLLVVPPHRWQANLPRTLKEHPVVTVVTAAPTPRRYNGIQPEFAPELLRASGADVLIVEADGARRRLLKAPADHEPAMPAGATLVIPVACLAAVGRPLAERHVHRPELAAEILGMEPGWHLTVDHVMTLLLDSRAGRKSVPPAARLWPVLTAADRVSAGQLAEVHAALSSHPDINGWIEAKADWTYSVRCRVTQTRDANGGGNLEFS
ncbi:MAG: selenium cofactor biosynthesis protein YqeC [Chloroflexota bacterium]|nr:selenium cofactor biosynthesis protein YqeC [Chloroflexota bacterium]MDE2920909.1 selenium cofactor biosynthesis protein YqeC [Chloroflexota bacterium]